MRALLVLTAIAALSAARSDPICDVTNDLERFDCHPEVSSSEENCVAQGCCWRTPNALSGSPLDNSLTPNIPYCFYPKNYEGYSVLNKSSTDTGLTIYLKRVKPSGVDDDISLLRVEVIEQADDIVRIRIVDPTRRRWEPPLPAPPAPLRNINPEYSVKVTQETRLEISRSQDDQPGTTLVSFDLASLVYTDRFIQISSKLPSQVVYGLGEHKGSLRRSMNFSRLTFFNSDRSPAYNQPLYGTHPLYINVEPDGRANGMWLLNSNAMDVILQPAPAITYRPIGGILDFFVFTGPTPARVVQQYQQMVGKPKMIPYWSLGFHLCRWGYTGTEHTRSILQKNLDAGVRIDVQWNDIDYMNDRNDFTIDPVNYKGLGSLVDQIHKDGRHYVLILDPAVSGSEKPGTYPPYERGLDYDVFVKDANGTVVRGRVWNRYTSIFPDFTHPNATPYWTEMFKNLHEEVAFDGAWIDMNEPSNLVDGHLGSGCPYDNNEIAYTPGDVTLTTQTLCMSDKHHWSEHYNVHNTYGFTEAIATYNALASVRSNKRPFIISRSSFSGHGHYAGHWTGDVYSTWEDLKDSIPGFLEFSFYGIPMIGVDICGFVGNVTEELCARWQAVGAFYPFSRNHNTIDTIAQDPASMGGKVLEVTKNVYYWRYKLLPYLYTLFYKAHVHGETVARPLFFENPEDAKTYDNDEQFLLGDALMVVPALHENQKTIDAYFPKGTWYDLQNRTATIDASTAGKQISLPAYDDTVHFFMRGGSAVFFQEPGETTTDSRRNPFGLYAFLDAKRSAVGEVYIDDGESIDAIEKLAYGLVSVVANERTIEIARKKGKIIKDELDRIHVYGIRSNPVSLRINQKLSSDFQFDTSRQLLSVYNIHRSMERISIERVQPNKAWFLALMILENGSCG